MAREYELRLTVAPDAAERLVSHRLIRSSLRHRQVGRQVSTYYDTPDLKLQAHRFGFRIRRADNKVTHTLKRSGCSLVDRGEWERAHVSQQPDFKWLRETPLAPLLSDGSIAEALGPRFTVEVTRTTLPLKHKHARIEAALDQGAILTGGLSLPLNELELEIKQGRSDAALDLARALARDLPLTLSLASKADRGYGVSDLSWGQPTESIKPPLTKRMTIAQAFEAVVQSCLNTFLKNVALIQDERDGAAVHKSRIALRHLRAACQLFRPVLRRKRSRLLRKDIRWLSNRLGTARDADVFQAAVLEHPSARDNILGASALGQLMRERQRRAHSRLRKALGSSRARLLYIDLLAFSEDGIRRRRRNKPYRPFVRAALNQQRRELASQARGLRRQTASDLHETRKAAKMLRYCLDLFADAPKLLPSRRWNKLGRRLRTLQKSLGQIQDQEALRTHLRATVLNKRRVSADRGAPAAALAAAHIASAAIESAGSLAVASRAARRL